MKFLSKLRKSLGCLLDTFPPCKTEAEGENNLKVYIKAFICDTGIEVSIIEMFISVKLKDIFPQFISLMNFTGVHSDPEDQFLKNLSYRK